MASVIADCHETQHAFPLGYNLGPIALE